MHMSVERVVMIRQVPVKAECSRLRSRRPSPLLLEPPESGDAAPMSSSKRDTIGTAVGGFGSETVKNGDGGRDR